MSVEITTLPSGLRVVTDRMDQLETASIGVWVAAGSRHEHANEQGLSHLLEHMAFKGTRRRSARDIAEEIETAGGDLNAATSVEQTAYYAHVLAADSGLALDILADILTESTFDAKELEREKGVILQEISAAEDTLMISSSISSMRPPIRTSRSDAPFSARRMASHRSSAKPSAPISIRITAARQPSSARRAPSNMPASPTRPRSVSAAFPSIRPMRHSLRNIKAATRA